MSRAAKVRSGVRVGHAPNAGKLVRFAAHELAVGLSAMLGEAPRVEAVNGLEPRSLAIASEGAAQSAAPSDATGASSPSGSAARSRVALPDDSFALRRTPASGADGAGGG